MVTPMIRNLFRKVFTALHDMIQLIMTWWFVLEGMFLTERAKVCKYGKSYGLY